MVKRRSKGKKDKVSFCGIFQNEKMEKDKQLGSNLVCHGVWLGGESEVKEVSKKEEPLGPVVMNMDNTTVDYVNVDRGN